MDEGDSKENKQIKESRTPNRILQRYLANVSNVLSTIGLRCPIPNDDGTNRFILGCRCYLLLNFRLFLVGLYISYEIFK
jgi:hypothetical protein